MKYCQFCGTKIEVDTQLFCPSCGKYIGTLNENTNLKKVKPKAVYRVAKAFMIVSLVAYGLLGLLMPIYLITYAWTIPMFVSMCRKMKRYEPIGVGFGVCTLLFFNTIAGILILCGSE